MARSRGTRVPVADAGASAAPDPTTVPAGSSPDVPAVTYTIDQLSQHSGVPARTIRFYQSEGVLPSPTRRGRVAFYDEEHVRRLQLIAELRDRGLRLDAIRGALDQLEAGGDSLHGWLGLSSRFSESWVEDRPVVMTGEELLARYDGGRPGLLADLVAQGLIRREGTGIAAHYLVPHLVFVDNAVMLERAGIDLPVTVGAALKIQAAITTLVGELVADFVTYFRDDLLAGARGGPDGVAAAVRLLRPAATDALRIMFGSEVDRGLRALIEGGPLALEAMASRGEASDPSEPAD